MLRFFDGSVFATSRCTYIDEIEDPPQGRIVIPVRFENLPVTIAGVDTACPWCILSQEEAKQLDPNYASSAWRSDNLVIRGVSRRGVLVRWTVTIVAEDGCDVPVDGTVFIPDEELEMPNFVGLDGLLNRIRFAVDPTRNSFYFGAP
jgi:hypothetical protein